MKEELKVNTDNKEEFDKYKKEILDRLSEVLDKGLPFIILAEGPEAAIVTMGGGPEKITRMIATAMNHSEEIEKILQIGVKTYELADKMSSAVAGSVKETTTRQAEIHKDSKINIVEALGCEDCPGKDDCQIYKLGNQTLDHEGTMKLLNELHKRHPEMVHMMSKGGDA